MDNKEIEEVKAKIKTLEELQEHQRNQMIERTEEINKLKDSICKHINLVIIESNSKLYGCSDCGKLIEVK